MGEHHFLESISRVTQKKSQRNENDIAACDYADCHQGILLIFKIN